MIESSPPHQATLPMTLFLAGPTGSGKSAVAVELAEMLDAEIVSSDAYQVYRELPILTAAPSPGRPGNGSPHRHWFPIHSGPKEPGTATEHYHRAMRCMEEIHARGKIAIVTAVPACTSNSSPTACRKRRRGTLLSAPLSRTVPRKRYTPDSLPWIRKERPRRMPPTGVMWNAIWKSSLPEENLFPSGRGTG